MQSVKPLGFKSPGNLWVEGNMWNKLCTLVFSFSYTDSDCLLFQLRNVWEWAQPASLVDAHGVRGSLCDPAVYFWFFVCCCFALCFFFFLYIKALRCSSHIIEFTLLRCTIDWFLEYSQNCTTVTIINFRAFSLHPKESLTVLISSHSVFPVLHLLQP